MSKQLAIQKWNPNMPFGLMKYKLKLLDSLKKQLYLEQN
jgi:hypothetical protein